MEKKIKESEEEKQTSDLDVVALKPTKIHFLRLIQRILDLVIKYIQGLRTKYIVFPS